MNLVLFTHPAYLGLQSQQRLVQMLAEGYAARGHRVEVRQPPAALQAALRARLPRSGLSKWAGYVDQYLLFPPALRRGAAADPPDTLYVFCDQALGPWVPLLAERPHVVHCHDLLALRSALGLVPENPTGWSGRVYQRYIRAGFRKARQFICISERTRQDLLEFGGVTPEAATVVHNGLNHPYQRLSHAAAWQRIQEAGLHLPDGPLLLHVGGGQWYKNTRGVLALHAALARRRLSEGHEVPTLVLVGPPPSAALQAEVEALPEQAAVVQAGQVAAPLLEALYSLSEALLFPSLAEGFGWPIAEGLACGCPVITTGEAPMTEVGGPHAHYLPRLASRTDLPVWADQGAALLCKLLDRPETEREQARQAGMVWTQRFDTDRAIERYLEIYAQVLAKEGRRAAPAQRELSQ